MADQEPRKLKVLERLVRCPVCHTTYRAQVSTRWFWRQVMRTFGYPQLTCVACLSAEATALAKGGSAEEYRNPEQGAV